MPGRNYRRQDGCWNCKHMFCALIHKSLWPMVGCDLDKNPPFETMRATWNIDEYGNCAFELPPSPTGSATDESTDALMAWTDENGVTLQGNCDSWEAKDARP